MAKLIQDITRKEEQGDPNGPSQPEKIEIKPAKIEIEKKFEYEKAPELKVEEEKEMPQPIEAVPGLVISQAAVPAKSPALEKIENVLSEDLEEIYFQLPPEKKAEFKARGEEAAGKLAILLSAVKIKVKKVLELIRNWLKLIPGVNKFFLEQEVKIKTDKLLELKEKGEITPFENQNKI
ncbi:MAG: hypothetical protein NTX00_00525 [Candidatus Parcubacteria bacterium]|nr:hypothetical protein [Candidatus Parcubacteria bacterium]